MESLPVLSMKNISKSFSGVKVLDDVHFHVGKREIVGLVGENGAGKSTLIKIINGIFTKDAGSISFHGNEYPHVNPLLIKRLGIATIYQELNLTPNQTVAENIFLGRELKSPGLGKLLGVADREAMRHKAIKALQMINATINPKALIKNLSLAQRQEVEITRALFSEAQLIIMDEPTSSLSREETRTLLNTMKALKSRDVSIVFVSHRLDEIFEVTERIYVLRDGKNVGLLETSKTTVDEIIRLMVGRSIEDFFPKSHAERGDSVLEVRNIGKKDKVENISFSLHRGEILGFAGLVGAGRTDVMRLIFGAEKKDTGDILIEGKPVTIATPLDGLRAGIGFVPEDRKLQGLIMGMSIRENLSLPSLKNVSRFSVIDRKKQNIMVNNFIKRLSVRPSNNPLMKVVSLSGGNQQKVVLAKWLALNPKILILDEPTRGVDVGAKNEIYRFIGELAQKGIGIIIVSSELPEVMNLSDRIVVMSSGRITAILDQDKATSEIIMTYATRGHQVDESSQSTNYPLQSEEVQP